MMSPNVAEVLDMVMKYAVFHDIQPLTMHIDLTGTATFDSLPIIFCCELLTPLKL